MNKKSKRLFCICGILFLTSILFAQISVDSGHEFYESVQKWEIEGLISKIPPVRPYPLSIIKEILQNVLENESASESSKLLANEYWNEITGKPYHLFFDSEGIVKNKDKAISLFGGVQGDSSFLNDYVSVGYKLGFNGYNYSAVKHNDKNEFATKYFSKFNPYYSALPYDTLQDPAKVGPLYGFLNANENIAIGSEKYFLQMGINRNGYGDFINQQLALNEGSYHNANMSFTIIQDKWNYSQLLASIGASKAYDGSGLTNNKFLTFHQIEFNPIPKITIGYYETIVFGKRFDFSYLIPAPYMAIQGLGGCDDNLQMGIRFNYKPFNGFLWANDIYVDDVSFNDLVKFDFDTKLRIAGKTGIIYSFENKYFDLLKVNYTLITPYTYSHWDFSDSSVKTIDKNTYSFQNYTNNGISMGTQLPPNSQNMNLSLSIKPISKLKLNFDFNFTMHGNIFENIEDDEIMYFLLADEDVFATDGSIFNHVFYTATIDGKYEAHYLDTAWNSLNLLNQKNKMLIFQGGLKAEYEFEETKVGKFSIITGFTAEYVKNKGVDSNIYPGGLVSEVENGYLYKNVIYSSKENLIAQIKKEWTSNFTNDFNTYFYLGCNWRF